MQRHSSNMERSSAQASSQLHGPFPVSISPQEAYTVGGSDVLIMFPPEAMLDFSWDFFLVFAGSTLRHVTTASLISCSALQAIIPEHNEEETTRIAVVGMASDGGLHHLASTSFHFKFLPIQHLARFLINSIWDSSALDRWHEIRRQHAMCFHQDVPTLDRELSRALHRLDLPENWNVLGSDASQAEPVARETLLHFTARLGLENVGDFLLKTPGGVEALCVANKQGHLPVEIAKAAGWGRLVDLFLSGPRMDHAVGSWQERKGRPPREIKKHKYGEAVVTCVIAQSRSSIEEDLTVLKNLAEGESQSTRSPTKKKKVPTATLR